MQVVAMWNLDSEYTVDALTEALDNIDFKPEDLFACRLGGAVLLFYKEPWFAQALIVSLDDTRGHLRDNGRPVRVSRWREDLGRWHPNNVPLQIAHQLAQRNHNMNRLKEGVSGDTSCASSLEEAMTRWRAKGAREFVPSRAMVEHDVRDGSSAGTAQFQHTQRPLSPWGFIASAMGSCSGTTHSSRASVPTPTEWPVDPSILPRTALATVSSSIPDAFQGTLRGALWPAGYSYQRGAH